jgi:uncharacterized membrane protein YidH (DUF202 family)
LAGVVLLANLYVQSRSGSYRSYLNVASIIMIAVTVILVFTSVMNCINAIAARKTSRSIHADEIPSRFLFNWGDTIRCVDGYSNFVATVTSEDYNAILGHAIAELWTDIMQHKRRHGYLRNGVSIFRYCIASFVVLAGVILAAVSK